MTNDESPSLQSYPEHLQQQIEFYGHLATKSRLIYQVIQWALIVMSAVTPVLIVAGGEVERWSAAVVAVGVAIGTSALKTFRFEESWINYRTTCERLRLELEKYTWRAPPYRESQSPLDLLVENGAAILLEDHQMWKTRVAPERGQED